MIKFSANNIEEENELQKDFNYAIDSFFEYVVKAGLIKKTELEKARKRIEKISCVTYDYNNILNINATMGVDRKNGIIYINKETASFSAEERLFTFWHELIHLLQSDDELQYQWLMELGAVFGSITMGQLYCEEHNLKSEIILYNETNIVKKFNKELKLLTIGIFYEDELITITPSYPNIQTVGLNICKALDISPITLAKLTLFTDENERLESLKNALNKAGDYDFEVFNQFCNFLMMWEKTDDAFLEETRSQYESTYDIINEKINSLALYFKYEHSNNLKNEENNNIL